jgi:5-methylcytosine-specific restriction endonuclease McrA
MPTRPSVHNSKQAKQPDFAGIKAFRSSWQWQQCRQVKLNLNPLCERCQDKGIVTTAIEVHHRVGLAQDMSLASDLDNLESLCSACHSETHRKTDKNPSRTETKQDRLNFIAELDTHRV